MRPVLALLILAACGPGKPGGPTHLSMTETQLYDSVALDKRRQFEEAIVGHNLRGDDVDVVVAEGGVLVGQQMGRPFNGTWVFRNGRFCYALAPRVTRSNARCFRAALIGREIHLVAVDERT